MSKEDVMSQLFYLSPNNLNVSPFFSLWRDISREDDKKMVVASFMSSNMACNERCLQRLSIPNFSTRLMAIPGKLLPRGRHQFFCGRIFYMLDRIAGERGAILSVSRLAMGWGFPERSWLFGRKSMMLSWSLSVGQADTEFLY